MGNQLCAQVRRSLDDRSAAKSALARFPRTSQASEAIALIAHGRCQAQNYMNHEVKGIALLAFAAAPPAQTM